jgi:hypothetical protein
VSKPLLTVEQAGHLEVAILDSIVLAESFQGVDCKRDREQIESDLHGLADCYLNGWQGGPVRKGAEEHVQRYSDSLWRMATVYHAEGRPGT